MFTGHYRSFCARWGGGGGDIWTGRRCRLVKALTEERRARDRYVQDRRISGVGEKQISELGHGAGAVRPVHRRVHRVAVAAAARRRVDDEAAGLWRGRDFRAPYGRKGEASPDIWSGGGRRE